MSLTTAHRAMAAFALHATTIGSLYARLPEIQRALGLSEAAFGLALLGMPAGVVLGSILVAPAIEAWGPKRLLVVGIPVTAAAALLAVAAPSAAALGGALFLFGLVFATGNVAMNVEADRIEAAEGSHILNRCHGWWAMGFLAATLVATLLIRLQVPPGPQFAGLTALLAALTPLLLGPMPLSVPRATAGARRRRFALPGRSTLLVGAFALAGVVIEATTRSWAVIYVRDLFGTVDWIAVLALPAIVATQTAGRFLGDGWVARWGTVAVGRGTSLMLLAGMLLTALAPATGVALAGFALVGLGFSIVQPQGFSAAARWGDRPAAENMAAFATFATLTSFLGPSLFGLLADGVGLRGALALFAPLPLLALAFAGALRPRTVAGT
jgi:MFS family permease